MRLIDADELTRRIEQSYFTKGEKRLFSVKVRHMPTADTTAIENALLKKIYDELLSQPDTWPEYLEEIFYRYLEERGLYHG